ncbi:MAG: hypothetical protein ACTSX8_05825 [Alphaproteobacteria bacterium]
MGLVDNITLTRNETYKGAAYIAYGNLTSFPGELESVINPSTYELNAELTAIAPTTEDGVQIGRSAEISDGIALDQKRTNWDEGEPTAWTMQVTTNVLDTDVDTLKVLWQTPDPVAITGSVVNQRRLPLGAPTTFTERELYIIQEDYYTGRLRVFAFRKAVVQPDGDLNVQSEEATAVPVIFKIRASESLAEHHGPFGFIFEEDVS